MTQTSDTFNVVARKPGKGPAVQYRRDRMVPAVIYGPKMENKICLIEEIFVLKHSGAKHESSIFQTKSDDQNLNSLKVMLKKIDTHPGTSRPVHVDLYAPDMTAKIKVNVTLEFEGTPVGVKEDGGVLQTNLREVEVECEASQIPDSIKVDISGIQLNESLHVSDMSFPAGATPVTAPERTICSVSQPKEEAPAEEATAETAEAAPAEEKKDA